VLKERGLRDPRGKGRGSDYINRGETGGKCGRRANLVSEIKNLLGISEEEGLTSTSTKGEKTNPKREKERPRSELQPGKRKGTKPEGWANSFKQRHVSENGERSACTRFEKMGVLARKGEPGRRRVSFNTMGRVTIRVSI